MGAVTVLVKSSAGSRVVRVPLDAVPATAQQLQARLEAACALPRGAAERLEFQGQALGGGVDLRLAGLSLGEGTAASGRGGGDGADELLFPNGWFASPLCRAYQRPLDASWPPARAAGYAAGLGWALAAFVALYTTSLLPAFT
ncbi:MAG: hypothetical protein J3K34DRAFT_466139 [Monoraphidium minutum]|nr:MAG: hypothetical protein J3K34DRAFT_466139 [Monoraphidium minutum]